MQKPSPIALFVYNRPQHTQKTIEALKKNELSPESSLFIYSEGPKDDIDKIKVNQVRSILDQTTGFKDVQIIHRQTNWGCANNIIDGTSQVIGSFGQAIILEDDIITNRSFLHYMNSALIFYKEEPQIFSITGYNFPPHRLKIPPHYPYDAFLCLRNGSWGWATWSDRWSMVDWNVSDFNEFAKSKSTQQAFNKGGEDLTPMLIDQMNGKIDAWDIRWTYHHFKNNGLAVWPVRSYTNNIGLDGSGTHCNSTTRLNNNLDLAIENPRLPEISQISPQIIHRLHRIFRKPLRGPRTILRELMKKLSTFSR